MFGVRREVADLNSPQNGEFKPCAMDWRFLPEPALLAKDTLRAGLVDISNRAALGRASRPVWRATLGRGPLDAVRRAGVLFIHIPKCGGTSVSCLLYGKNLPHYTAAFWHEVYGDAVADLPGFALMREPLDRLISAYRMVVAGGTDLIAYSRYWRLRLRPWLGSIESFTEALADGGASMQSLPTDLWPQTAYLLGRDGSLLVPNLFLCEQLSRVHPSPIDLYLGGRRLPWLNANTGPPISRTPRLEYLARRLYASDYLIYDVLSAAATETSDVEISDTSHSRQWLYPRLDFPATDSMKL